MKRTLLPLLPLLLASCVVDLTPPPPPRYVPPAPPPPRQEPTPPPPPKHEPAPPDDELLGGKDFDRAAALSFEKEGNAFVAKWSVRLVPNEKTYFTFEAKPGYRIELRSSSDKRWDVDLLNADRESVQREGNKNACEVDWLPGAGERSYRYYLTMRTVWDKVVVRVQVRMIESTDAGTDGDAADDFDQAIELKGDAEGWLAGDSRPLEGSDRVDLFKLAVSKDQSLRVQITPHAKLRLEGTLFDQNRKKAESDAGKNQGAIARLEWTPTYDGWAYLRVAARSSSSGGSYRINLETRKRDPEKESKKDEKAERREEKKDEKKDKKD